jgi:hypothetical protein
MFPREERDSASLSQRLMFTPRYVTKRGSSKWQEDGRSIYTISASGGGKSRVTNDDAYPYGLSWGSEASP